MIRRATVILIAVIALLAGVAAAWVALSVPRDLRAESLLKEARGHLEASERDLARQKLEAIIKQFPRTDAAAEASWALFRLSDLQRRELQTRVDRLEKERSLQEQSLAAQQKALEAERTNAAQELAARQQKIDELEKAVADAAARSKKRK